MTAETMPSVKAHRIGALEPAHPRDQIGLRRFYQQVIVIAHQHKGMHPPTRPRAGLPESQKETLPIHVIAKDRLPSISPLQQMIDCPGKFQPSFPRHAFSLPGSSANLSSEIAAIHRLTPDPTQTDPGSHAPTRYPTRRRFSRHLLR